MRDRAWRRHQYHRVKKRWEKIVRNVWYPNHGWGYNGFAGHGAELEFEEFVEAQAQMHAKTRKPCSCFMCGNPRHHWGELTKQELLAEESFHEQLFDVEDDLTMP